MKKQILIFLIAMSILEISFGQKTTRGDCRTKVEANYSHGFYQVIITNNSFECSTYSILFPNGEMIRETENIFPGKYLYYNYPSVFLHGSVIVTPLNQAPATCPFGSVQVNL